MDFLSYNLSNHLTMQELQEIKNNFNALYIDLFDNPYNNLHINNRKFSNMGIGYVLEKAAKAETVYLMTNDHKITYHNKFNWLELIAVYKNKQSALLIEKKDLLKGMLQHAANIKIQELLNQFKDKNAVSANDQTFLVYNRDSKEIVEQIKNLKQKTQNQFYIDFIDNQVANQNPELYSAFNQDCRFSPEIFDFVFEKLISAKNVVVLESDLLYYNQFAKTQISFANYLEKEILVLTKEDFKQYIKGDNHKLNLKPMQYEDVIKKYDCLFQEANQLQK